MQAGNICSAGIKGLHADTDGRGGTNWVLDMPGQAFSGADSALREAVRRADRAGCFEELCLLYVAIARPSARARRSKHKLLGFARW